MDIFLIIVAVMAVLGVMDLLVGVSNDAVNFTNSAVGSRAASRKIILIVSTFGILLGALSSSGMMEVARKGIFHPEFFSLAELMFLFLAVMVSDIILLDLYNTLGLPTSTTVSLVFELLGASLVLALLKADTLNDAFKIINSESALKIIFGIALSVILAFFAGLILMFFFRLIFSFRLDKTMRWFGGIFSGLAVTVVIFFILLTAMKGSTFLNNETLAWIQANFKTILVLSFIGFSILFQILILSKINVLKIVVLFGTAALAMAFASNDLVNFIGVPIASLQTHELIKAANWDANTMATGLGKEVMTDNRLLIGAALIMIFALFKSKKAETVTRTEVSLGSQGETIEAYQSSLVARVFVQIAVGIYYPIKRILPSIIRNWISSRFKQSGTLELVRLHESDAFDLLRASVNILIASALILIGTIEKLPLSTTFVTFMVAMGTSLADGAWQKENAVNRVSGVLTVVGGWFMTAVFASFTGGFIAALFYYFGFAAVVVVLSFTFFLVLAFNRIHKKRKAEYDENLEKLLLLSKHPEKALSKSLSSLLGNLLLAKKAMNTLSSGYIGGKKKDFKQASKTLKNLKKNYESSISGFLSLVDRHFDESDFQSIHPFTNALGYIDRITENLTNIHRNTSEKIDRFQTALTKDEREDIKELRKLAEDLFELLAQSDKVPGLVEKARSAKKTKELSDLKVRIYKNQMKRIRKGDSKLKSSVAYFLVIEELVDINENLFALAEELVWVLPWIEAKKKQFAKGNFGPSKLEFPKTKDKKKKKK
ncbi:inorganic phosphate transporter [Leptospira licerasiae]|uniref:Phosphate transporter n=1 Tax=Leptospira licerasiae str. MMD4847 TaxID=1049971 RepID=A0ABN0HAJ7_9LEPT|nr:inorganic phosphate transporter [Leptospira licerasiae]EIE00480.1 phosphate transporter family protein [Leptospira licerasiae serovar Varillal str. VAR 010]EJZ42718.1 phosphate transporter family protein [Leptospira licerasiae str. MMD4847]